MATVKELIKVLQEIDDQDRIVVMSKDGEGNSFSPYSDPSIATYVPDSTWSGEIYDEDELEERENGKPALVLWPTN